jgi:hypothetical protein
MRSVADGVVHSVTTTPPRRYAPPLVVRGEDIFRSPACEDELRKPRKAKRPNTVGVRLASNPAPEENRMEIPADKFLYFTQPG